MPATFDAVSFEFVRDGIMLPVIEGRIGEDDRPVRIVVDSGGGGPVGIYIAEALGEVRGVSLGASEDMPTPFGGRPVRLRSGSVSRVTIGGVTLTDAPIAQSDLVDRLAGQVGAPVDAIIGHNFLAGRVVQFDFPARQIDLAAEPGQDSDATPTRQTPQGHHLLVDACVNGRGPYVFLVDTGSMRTHVSPAVADQVAMPTGGESIVRGAGGETRSPTGPATVRVGGREVPLAPVIISAELDRLSARHSTRIDGILGLDWMMRSRMTIDYPGQRMWVAQASGSASESRPGGQ